MTETKRIFLNIVATYGRSLFVMACGLFTSRWALMALGAVDYGLLGVVGCLVTFVAFFNSLFASSVGRFYAFSVGEARKGDPAQGLEHCRQWFNTAVVIHLAVPSLLLLVGYPIGEYAVRHWLTIPPARVDACVWVFRFSCLSCLFAMVGVPFTAMYTAKQYIAELTIYSFAQSLATLVILHHMASTPGDWLAWYGFWLAMVAIIPQLLIIWRAFRIFPECRVCRRYLWNPARLKELFSFASWQFFGNFGYLVKVQGMAILVNKLFGPRSNASMNIANLVSSQAGTLTASVNNAFAPAITNLAGAGENERMLAFAYRTCKFGMLLSLLFVLPFGLELEYVLTLWLKTPPPLLMEATWLTMATLVVDESVRGVGLAVTAKGRIAFYYALLGSLNILTLPLAWLWIWLEWGGFPAVFGVVLAVRIIAMAASVLLGRSLIGFSPGRWARGIVLPVVGVSAVAFLAGFATRSAMAGGFWRFVVVTIATVCSYLLLSWRFVLNGEERRFCLGKSFDLIARLRGRR